MYSNCCWVLRCLLEMSISFEIAA